MKSILYVTALAALMMGPGMALGENGSDRLIDSRLQQQGLVSNSPSQDTSDPYVQMIKTQPTASGVELDQQDQQFQMSEPDFESPIQRDRMLYRSAH